MKIYLKLKLLFLLIIIISSLIIHFNISNSFDRDISISNKEIIISEVTNINKFIPLEVELSHSVVISDNFTDSQLFNKSKEVTFFADCSYSIDLSSIENSDILFNSDNNITIKVPKPEVFSISIKEDKTEFSETNTGFLRFGDLEISSEEFIIIINKIKQSFEKKMDDADLHSLAIENTKNFIENLLLELTDTSYTITLDIY